MPAEVKYTLTKDAVLREVTMRGRTNREARNIAQFLAEVGKRGPVDTGLMPIGVRSYAQAGNHQQFLIEMPPGINRIIWGEREGDRNAKGYLLAQPFRVVIGDFVDGAFLGARMFYSPTPINHLDQPLFHQNVPNINCRGYEGNGVGWVCLYHKGDTTKMSVAQKANYLINRCGGQEAYNNRNMSETDGTRLYQEKGAPEYLWNPEVWETKSDEEGWEWTLNPDLWLPVKVRDQDHQDKHYARGKPLTVRMAMDGFMHVYYGDTYQPKPVPALRRGESVDLFDSLVTGSYTSAAVVATPAAEVVEAPKPEPTPKKKTTIATNPAAEVAPAEVAPKPHPVKAKAEAISAIMAKADEDALIAAAKPTPSFDLGPCTDCKTALAVGRSFLVEGTRMVCSECFHDAYASCKECGYATKSDQMVWEEREGIWLCSTHGTPVACARCAMDVPLVRIAVISPRRDDVGPIRLCPDCTGQVAFCNGCDRLYDRTEMFEHGLHVLCELCLQTHKRETMTPETVDA